MIFHSIEFFFVFLPVVLAIFILLRWSGMTQTAKAFLVGASLLFYSWPYPPNLILLILSIVLNHQCGEALVPVSGQSPRRRQALLAVGIAINLFVLGYFKYKGFAFELIDDFFDFKVSISKVVLPLAISFFTFQQIAYLVDTYNGAVKRTSLIDYALFVSFFPQLIAGPIILSKEVLPQYEKKRWRKPDSIDFSIGATLFTIGLIKKAGFGDQLDPIAGRVFDTVALMPPTFLEAWTSLLAFNFQIYFDFSGYTDMAIGLARMFSVRLPLNFNSPYRSLSVIDFWKRWHMTLGRFFNFYLFNPITVRLARRLSQRNGLPSTGLGKGIGLFVIVLAVPTFFTMTLMGLWHGAAVTFVAFGALHGIFIVLNHLWRRMKRALPVRRSVMGQAVSWGLTFSAVLAAWVFFRADSIDSAISMFMGLVGANGIVLPPTYASYVGGLYDFLVGLGISFDADVGTGPHRIRFYGRNDILWVAVCFFVVFLLPNSQNIVGRYLNRATRPGGKEAGLPAPVQYEIVTPKNGWLRWRPTVIWGGFSAATVIGLTMYLSDVKPFVYFEF